MTDIRSPIANAIPVVLSGAFMLATFFTTACGSLCGNQLTKGLPSPDNSKILYVSDRDCGAATGFVTHVAVLAKAQVFNKDTVGNVFIAEPNRDQDNFFVRADWTSPSAIKITYRSGSKIYTKVADLNGVRISYDQF